MKLLWILLSLLYATSDSIGIKSKRSSKHAGKGLFSAGTSSKVLPSRYATNSTSTKLNTSKLCDATKLQGHWIYGTNESTDFGNCYTSADVIFGSDAKAARRSMDNYGCKSYQSAEFSTPSCIVLSSSESNSILKQKLLPGSFVFVGDSLMMQQVRRVYRVV